VRNPFKRQKSITGTPAVLEAMADRTFQPWPVLGGGSRQIIQDAFNTAQSASYAWMYAHSPAIRTVIDVLVRNIGQLDLRLYEEIDESERQPMPDHPAALSLRYPSEQVTSDAFIRSLIKDFLIFDNAYALLTPAPGQQLDLNRVPAEMMEIRGASLFNAEGYRVHLRDGTFQDFTPDQILHWRGENPTDPRMGFSRLETLRSVIAEDAALAAATQELANSGLTQPVYGYRPVDAPEISNDARKGLEEDLANRMRKANRRPFILEEGTELRPYGVSPRDAQMIEIRRWAIERVAAVYGVPLGMVGLDPNVDKAQTQFYADTLPPYCEDFTKMLTQRICVRVYNDTALCFEFNLDEKLMGDERLKTLVSASGRAVLTTNEARAMVNRPPIDTGDELVTPLNVIVGDNPKPSPQIMGPQDPNGPPQDGSGRSGDQPQQLPPPKALKAVNDPTAGTAEDFKPLPQLHPNRKAELDRQQRNIDRAQGAIQRHYNRLERAMANKGRKGNDRWDRWDREFADDIHTVVQDIVEKEGDIYAFKFASTFDMARVQHYLKAMATGAAEGINATIRQEIDELGLDQALARSSQHVASAGASLGAAATRWAREEAARQSPSPEGRVKTWVADTQRHAEFDGDTVALGDDWPAGFAPGTAPGCMCTQVIQ
jgi:HK97 family phage portal protein